MWLEWRFEGQQNVADLFKFLFPDVLLKLPDAQLETEAQSLQMAYSADLGEALVSEVRSFRREFRQEIEKCASVRDILTLLLSSDVLSSMPELGTACILLLTSSLSNYYYYYYIAVLAYAYLAFGTCNLLY